MSAGDERGDGRPPAGEGDVHGSVPERRETYVHGGGGGAGPRSTQEARGGGRRGRGERAMVPREEPRSYYGRPVVKPPVWTWEVPLYFFTGGLGGASAALAFGAELTGRRSLARSSWALAFAGIAVSPALLTMDLGKPSRFLNMLRVVKVTSPMSLGAWLLVASGAAVTPAAARGALGLPVPLGRASQALAAALGLPLATYTAVLLSNTAVPVWSEARWQLPVAFAGSAAAAAGAGAAVLTPGSEAEPARRLAIAGAVVEGVASEAMSRRLGELGRPYHEGTAGRLARLAKGLTGSGAAALALARRGGRRTAVAGAALVIAGSLCERWAVYRAGFQSASDPDYTVEPQRERVAAR